MNNDEVAELHKIVPIGTKVTIVDGVYAVGDIRNTVLRQVITAAADGAIAATHAVEMLMG